jgi:hypothetical protein
MTAGICISTGDLIIGEINTGVAVISARTDGILTEIAGIFTAIGTVGKLQLG